MRRVVILEAVSAPLRGPGKIFSADVHAVVAYLLPDAVTDAGKKVRVAIDWTLDLFFARDTVRLALEGAGRDPRVSVGDDSASRRLE